MASPQVRAGATTPGHGFGTRFAVWRAQHREQLQNSVFRLLERPFASAITLLLLTIAILLPSLLYIGLKNIEQWINYSDNGFEVSAYLALSTDDKQARQLANTLAEWPEVAAVRYISPAQAASELSRSLGIENMTQGLPDNPLPPTLQITLRDLNELQNQASSATEKLEQLSIVDSAFYNVSWFNKAQALLGLGQHLAIGLAGLLGLGVVLVVGNTIRLAIESRSEEIRVAKLVGATDGYVRRPFLYMGAWLGLLAAALAMLLAGCCWLVLTNLVSPLESAYSTSIQVVGLPLSGAAATLLLCTALGWLGALLICNSHIRSVVPE